MRARLAPVPVAAAAAIATALAATGPSPHLLGHSVRGRAIGVRAVGDPGARTKVLVVGSVHGVEPAGRAVVAALAGATPTAGVELLLVRDLNPDGLAARTRGNARGVDLNRNSSQGWRRQNGLFASGPRPWSEPETRMIRRLILRERPRLTIWYHQHLALVDFPEAGGGLLTRRYAALTGLPAHRLRAYPGSLSRWENVRVRRGSSFVVELPAGRLSPAAVRRHANAVLALAARLAAALKPRRPQGRRAQAPD